MTFNPMKKEMNLDLSKLNAFAGDKENVTSLRAISPFPTVFSKDLYCRHLKIRVCLGQLMSLEGLQYPR